MMKRFSAGVHVGIVASVLLSAAPLYADSPPGEAPFDAGLTQSFSLEEGARVGQPVELRLEIEHPPGVSVEAPSETGTTRVGIVAAKTTPPVGEQAPTSTTITLTLVPWRTGTATVEPMPIILLGSAGEVVLKTEPVSFKVISAVELDQELSLGAARPPVEILTTDYTPLWVGGGLGALALTGMIAFLLARRRFEPEELGAAPRPIHVVAMERLSGLASSGLIEEERYVEFYTTMSEVIREYLGKRYGFPGLELTTTEIMHRLAGVAWPRGLSQHEVRHWLRRADRVKFTGLVTNASEAEAALRQAFSLVELTRAREEELANEEVNVEPPARGEASEPTRGAAIALAQRSKASPEDQPVDSEDSKERGERSRASEPLAASNPALAGTALGAMDWATLAGVVEGLEEE